METNGNLYQLPLVRYAIDEERICHLFAVQVGRNRICLHSDPEYQRVVHQMNTGLNKFRDVSPSLALSNALF